MINKRQYENRKKCIKLQDADFEELLSQDVSIPVNKITVEDDSGSEVDETVFAELSTVNGICFVVKDGHDNDLVASQPGASQSTPSLSSCSGSSLSVSGGSSDNDVSRQTKRMKRDEEALQSSVAKDVNVSLLINQIMQTKPGGTTVVEEYEDSGTLSDCRRRQMVNIHASHIVDTDEEDTSLIQG